MRFLALALAAIPVFVSSAELTARAALNLAPTLPDTAQAAYAQWIDQDGDLKPGPAFKKFEDAMNARITAQSNAAMQQPAAGGGTQMEMAQRMQAQYGTPEGQAKLKSMSPAELMAMAQQMQPPQPTATVVSDHDQALIKQIQMYPEYQAVEQQIQKARSEEISLDQQWDAERNALNDKKAADHTKLKACGGESGEPSGLDTRTLELKYADLRIAMAARYLPKYQAVEKRVRTVVSPRVDYGDSAMQAWGKLDNPSLKQMQSSVAQAAQNQGVSDASVVAAFVSDPSKRAAEEIAQRKHIAEMYKDAKGC